MKSWHVARQRARHKDSLEKYDGLWRVAFFGSLIVPQSEIARELRIIATEIEVRQAAGAATGILIYDRDRFLQILEGPRARLHELTTAVEHDRCRKDIAHAIDGPIERRAFAGPGMAVFFIDSVAALDENQLDGLRRMWWGLDRHADRYAEDLIDIARATAVILEPFRLSTSEPDSGDAVGGAHVARGDYREQ